MESAAHEVTRHTDELRRLARCLAKDDAAEADLLQDTWVAALTARPRRIDRMGAWLRQVMRNELRAGIRRERRRRAREQQTPHDTQAPSLDDDLVHTELVLAMLQAVDALAEPYRAVVRARFFADRTPTEIAVEGGTPPATVRWQLHEGLRRIREGLDARYGDRRHWHGGALAIGAWPADRVAKTTMMTRLVAMKWIAGLSIAGGAATIVAVQWPVAAAADPTDEDAVIAAAPMIAKASHDVADIRDARAAASTQQDDDAPHPPEDPQMPCEGCRHHGDAPPRMWMLEQPDVAAALAACEQHVPGDTPPGRFEIAVTVRGTAQGNAIEDVDVTRGRKLPCVDADAVLEDADEPDVVRFDAVAACIERTLAPTFADALADGEVHAIDVVVGDPDRPARPQGPPLPEPSAAIAGVDPEDAIAKLDLLPRGGEDARVSIVECGGYDCSYCNRARATTDELADRYGDEIALHYLQMPLDMHPGGELTARAAVAAGLQGKFWQMHDALFDDPKLRTEASIVAHAVALGMDGDRFARDLAAPSTAQAVADQRGVCMNAGAQGTPAFFIDGDLVVGSQEIEAFTSVIDDALQKQSGAKRRNGGD